MAAALQRRSFLVLRGRKLYPNIFAFLVGPPGGGKTTAIIEARELIKHIPAIKTTPTKVTPERFINLLAGMHTHLPPSPGKIMGEKTASVSALLDELSVFIRPKDYDFMGILTDLFDCPPVWEYSTLSREEDRLENVHLNIIGGITPKSIAENLGAQAFGLGFTSRIIFVYADGLEEQNDLFSFEQEPDRKEMIEALKEIAKISGEFILTSEAKDFVEEWHRQKMEPLPADSRFAEYLPRRIIHWLKLGLLISASRRSTREILLSDMQTAKEWLLEVESTMGGAVELVGKNPIQQAIEDVHRWMLITYNTNGKRSISESSLRHKLSHAVPLQFHNQAVDLMLSTGRMVSATANIQLSAPNRMFVPLRLEK